MDKATSTKKKLTTIIDGFDSFDNEMRVGTRQRREKEENKVAELKIEMGRLETVVSSEIRRRVEMNKSVQAWCEAQVAEMTDRLEQKLESNKSEVMRRLEVLSERIDDLENRFRVETERIPREVAARGEELAGLLHKFELSFDAERKSRMEREQTIIKTLGKHQHEVSSHFEAERDVRENTYREIRQNLEDNILSRAKADERLRAMVDEEVATLKNNIAKESQVREREDDEIVDALNRFTTKLQASLGVMNSPDT